MYRVLCIHPEYQMMIELVICILKVWKCIKKIDVKKDKNFRYHLIQITILIMMRCFDIT